MYAEVPVKIIKSNLYVWAKNRTLSFLVQITFLKSFSDLNVGLERSKKVFPDMNKNGALTLPETDTGTK